MRLRGSAPGEEVLARWDLLQREAGAQAVIHARQVHGAGVRAHRTGPPGLRLVSPCDGHLTADPGVLLTVSLADCVPVFLVDPATRALALLHAGWRGVAAGIVEAGVGAMRDRFGLEPGDLEAHVGPAIARDGYEVGPEVHRALGLPDPGAPAPVDLRAAILERLRSLDVLAERIGVSSLDTLSDERFFSHRGGDGGRQVAFLGWVRPRELRP
jgi:polyphenol oxidase